MWTDAIQFRNSTSSFTSMELCKNTSKAASMVKESQVGKRKLSGAGTAILNEHLRLHPEDTHPTSYTLEALLERVRVAQNNPDITYSSVSKWFQRRRMKLQKKVPHSTVAPTPPASPFKPDVLRALQTLVDATPNPSPDVLEIWSSFFQVPKAMLNHAINVILPGAASQDAKHSPTVMEQSALDRLNSGLPFQRLPTPANSSTPEPVLIGGSNTQSLRKECTIPTPVCSKATDPECGVVAPPQQPHSHTPMEFISMPIDKMAHSQELSPPPTPVVSRPQVNSQASETEDISTTATLPQATLTKDAIISGIHEACVDALQISQDVSPPKTAAEFQALFASYETKLRTLSRMFDIAL